MPEKSATFSALFVTLILTTAAPFCATIPVKSGSAATAGFAIGTTAGCALAGMFLWPVWARAHTRNAKERQQMAKRFSREILRLSLHGTLRPEKFPELDMRMDKGRKPRT